MCRYPGSRAPVKALITGASGFVGPHLAAHLEASGDEVVCTDRASGADVCDEAQIADVFATHRPEVVFHLAGDSDVGGSWHHPRSTFLANAVGTLNVMEAARAAGVRRVVAIGSADVYGKVAVDELPLTEHSALRPASPYAASKIAADAVTQQAWLGHGLETIRVRAFNHLGPGQSDRFVAPAIATRSARNELDAATSVPVGNLEARRDITDVRDVVRAYRLLAVSGEPGEVYNVCSGTTVAIAELAEQLVAMARHPMELVVDESLLRPVDIPVLCGDNTKLCERTGWEPELSLTTTLSDLMDDCRARLAASV